MKSTFFYSIIALLLLLNVLLLSKQSKLNDNIKLASEINAGMYSRDSALINNLKYLIKSNYSEGINTTNFPFLNTLNDAKIVLYINEGVCGSCVQELLGYMEQLGNIIGKDKLLLLGNFQNENDFKKYIKDATAFIENSMYCNNKEFLKGIKTQPAIFIIDKNHEIRLFYIPNYLPDYKETYFTNILPLYFLGQDYRSPQSKMN